LTESRTPDNDDTIFQSPADRGFSGFNNTIKNEHKLLHERSLSSIFGNYSVIIFIIIDL